MYICLASLVQDLPYIFSDTIAMLRDVTGISSVLSTVFRMDGLRKYQSPSGINRTDCGRRLCDVW